MLATEYDKFAKLLYGIGAYYKTDISIANVQVYQKCLQNIDYDQISRAIQIHIADPDEGQFFPKVAHIMRHIGGGNADRALTAWAKVDKAVRTIGDHQSVVFDDPVIHSVITDMGGWIGFGNVKTEEWTFKQNEFTKRYRGYLERGEAGEYPAKLTGRHDAYNRQIGKENNQETLLIGDQAKAINVLKLGETKTTPKTYLTDFNKIAGLITQEIQP